MISNTIFPVLYGIILVTGAKLCGTNAHESQCNKAEFWNSDVDQCVPCTTCIKYPKTPSCDTCAVQEEASDVWKLVAITSFSVLIVLLISGVLVVGVLVHHYRSRRRSTLREPIEETTGPLYQV